MVIFLSKDTEDQLVCWHGRACRIMLKSVMPENSKEKTCDGEKSALDWLLLSGNATKSR